MSTVTDPPAPQAAAFPLDGFAAARHKASDDVKVVHDPTTSRSVTTRSLDG